MTKFQTPRDGDKNLDKPPFGVVVSIMGLIGGHWSDCIITDNRPEPVTVIPDDGYADGGEPYTDEEMNIIERY